MPLSRFARALAGGGVAAGTLLTGYAVWETRAFRLRDVTVPLLPPGHTSLRVLHLSDIHLTPRQRRKQDWLAGLAELDPDLVVNTGDNIAHRDSIPRLRDCLGPLLDVPGVFVLGSNDYYSPTLRNPLRYLLPDNGKRHTSSALLPWRELKDLFTGSGWVDLTNQQATLKVGATRFAFAGVDDPHLRYDRLEDVGGPADPDADVRLGVAHAPYLRVLDQFAADGYDAILAGHTHGGQLCLPWRRALVTNCDLDRARASGLSTHPASGDPARPGTAWLHVCPGAGTSPYAVARFCCRPAASLLTLTERRPDSAARPGLG